MLVAADSPIYQRCNLDPIEHLRHGVLEGQKPSSKIVFPHMTFSIQRLSPPHPKNVLHF